MGKARMNAAPTESPWKMPRLCARFDAGVQSATYAWQTGVMHDEQPSMRSAR